MTVDEYLALEFVPPSGFKDELLEGELVLSPTASWKHGVVCGNLCGALKRVVDPSRFHVIQNTTMLATVTDAPQPDVYVIERSRLPDDAPFPAGSPELAIEVISPSERTGRRKYKRSLYLSTGSLDVWEVDLQARRIDVFHRSGAALSFSAPERIPVLAGLISTDPPPCVDVCEVFDGL
jgi:Uma2 family endonuclease